MTLTAHKPNAQETRYGAGLLGVLQVDLEDYSTRKGFLAQAKYLRSSQTLKASEFARLQRQCEKMLEHSTASYVFMYQIGGITVLPAVAVAALKHGKVLPELKARDLDEFFEEHFGCFIDDRAMHRPSDETLEELRRRVEACHVLRLSATSND